MLKEELSILGPAEVQSKKPTNRYESPHDDRARTQPLKSRGLS
jgi:hypothetical protein